MLERLLQQYGYWMVYFGTLFEPDATLVAALFFAHRGYLQTPVVFGIAWLATVTMSEAWFWVARRQGQAMLDRMTERHPRYARVRRWVEANGYVLVFFSRFIWGLRMAIAAASGATGMKASRFVAIDCAGATLWVAVIGTVGYAIAHALGQLWRGVRKHDDAIALTVVGVIGLVALWHGWARRRADKAVRDTVAKQDASSG